MSWPEQWPKQQVDMTCETCGLSFGSVDVWIAPGSPSKVVVKHKSSTSHSVGFDGPAPPPLYLDWVDVTDDTATELRI